jgi:hypothetical protein
MQGLLFPAGRSCGGTVTKHSKKLSINPERPEAKFLRIQFDFQGME